MKQLLGRSLRRALTATVGGDGKSYVIALGAFALVTWRIAKSQGWLAALDEMSTAWERSADTALVLSIYFAAHLLVAPYLVERDDRRRLESELETLKAQVGAGGRRLTPVQKRRISRLFDAEGIAGGKSVFVYCYKNDECFEFGSDFAEACRQATLDGMSESYADNVTLGFPVEPSTRDLIVLEYQNSDPTLVEAFSDLLAEFGCPHKISKVEGESNEHFRLIVGKPSTAVPLAKAV